MGVSSLETNKKYKIPVGVNSMCVEYSFSHNLGNIFTYREVNFIDGTPVSSYME